MNKTPGKQPALSGLVWLRNIGSAPSFRYRDFRFLWLSSLFSSIGMTGEQVVVSWLVLTITDSPLMVGVTLGIRMAPFFLLGVLAGAIADRVSRRRLVALLNMGMASVNIGLGLLLLFGPSELWFILLLTFIGGGFRALEQTARQSYAYDIVGQSLAVNALAYVGLSMRIGGVAGSLAAGSMIAALGVGTTYLILAGAHVMAASALLPVHSEGQAAPKARHPVWHNLKEYFGEVGRNRALLTLVMVTGAVEILGFSHQVLLPSLARDVLGAGPGGLGILSAFRSVGGIVGIFLLSSLGDVRRKGVLLLLALHFFGGSLVLLAFAPNFVLAVLVVTLLNGAAALSDILSQSLMQLVVPNELRGRAMGSWVLAIGTAPIGHIQIGALASALGVTFALTFNGIGLFALGLFCLILLPRLRRL